MPLLNSLISFIRSTQKQTIKINVIIQLKTNLPFTGSGYLLIARSQQLNKKAAPFGTASLFALT